ncbi:MAG TPA: MauE/DoxX family redox-associated membrane protein [Solirubrobacteraceae bacterium]|nr:MauE/DoxX family redox-associated membrane protein [Solirubrobacteraceae bacterium]
MALTIAWLLTGAVLLAAAGLKAADRTGTIVALAAYGLPGWLAAPAFAALVAAEAALSAGLAAGIAGAAYAAALVLAGFLAAQVVALAQGNAGAPCGCFGAGGRLTRAAAARTGLLASVCAVLPLLGEGPRVPLVLSAAVAGAVVVLAAGRRNAPRGALEIDGEGPPLNVPSPLAAWFGDARGATEHGTAAGLGDVWLALFTSPGCALCRRVAPAAQALDGVAVRRFDEVADSHAWAAARVPGAPFAVALGRDGVALAKGTVNDARQLASIVDAARARRVPASSRRAFLGRAGGLAASAAGAGMVGAVIRPGDAEAHHFCGHIYTTDGCPHPTGLPRIDRSGLPLRARDGRSVDDLGRLIDALGRPVDEDGRLLCDLDGRPLPAAPRTPVCQLTGARHGIAVTTDGAWYRCCQGRVRKLVDCCSPNRIRINGDRALRGYCYERRKVFCVMYFQSTIPC